MVSSVVHDLQVHVEAGKTQLLLNDQHGRGIILALAAKRVETDAVGMPRFRKQRLGLLRIVRILQLRWQVLRLEARGEEIRLQAWHRASHGFKRLGYSGSSIACIKAWRTLRSSKGARVRFTCRC